MVGEHSGIASLMQVSYMHLYKIDKGVLKATHILSADVSGGRAGQKLQQSLRYVPWLATCSNADIAVS